MAFDPYTVRTRLLTSDGVLAVFVRWFTHERPFKPNAPVPYRDITIRQLRRLMGHPDWRELVKPLAQSFDLSQDAEYWKPVLSPERRRTLRELCDFIAARVQRPVIEPLSIAGTTSLSAGAFPAVRQIFAEAGADVSDLRPSSAIEPYLLAHREVFPRLMRLAPGELPEMLSVAPVHEGLGCASGILWVVGLLAYWLNWGRWSWIYYSVVGLMCQAMTYILWRTTRPMEVGFRGGAAFAN